ncbi:MAG: F0F1 ATP synthase subunit A [Candidatus Dependentiae bacterium]|nr:F0F1 ATP synthase subunit A [Candidatus Dependentiae bacterium]
MQDTTSFLHTHTWQPLSHFTTHPFFTLNRETIINTWIVLALLLIIALLVHLLLKREKGILHYLVFSGAQAFIDLTTQTLGSFQAHHFYFCASLFIFIAFCNCITIVPWTEEPTTDINTTLALGILSFLYTQWYAVRTHGIIAYIKEYFAPLFVMFPLHVIGKLSSVVSLSFRLFGNIFGGSVIARIFLSFIKGSLLFETAGLGLNIIITLFFVIFEGLLQAFVFSMLSLTYLAIAVEHEEPTQIGDIP